MPLGLLAFGSWFFLGAIAVPADAATSPVAFDLARDPGTERCPDHDTLAGRIARRL